MHREAFGIEVSSEQPSCTAENHLCGISEREGCSSCGHMCHRSCADNLCRFDACEFCSSFGVDTHPNSDLCKEVQMECGCHECKELGCDTSQEFCVAKRIPHDVSKPRAFKNLGNSCWINAALQTLFASPLIKQALETTWRQMPHKRTRRPRIAPTLRGVSLRRRRWECRCLH